MNVLIRVMGTLEELARAFDYPWDKWTVFLHPEQRQLVEQDFSGPARVTEWEQVVDAWQLNSWDAYRDVARLGRKTRLPETQRRVLWSIFEKVQAALAGRSFITQATMFARLTDHFASGANIPFDFAVVDEAQDVSVSQMRFLAALGSNRPNALFFAGDLGQRIFQQPFSWKSLGVDIRGRNRRADSD